MWSLRSHPHWFDRVSRIQAKGYVVPGWGSAAYREQLPFLHTVPVGWWPEGAQQLMSQYQQPDSWPQVLEMYHNKVVAAYYYHLARRIRSVDPDLLAYHLTSKAALKYDAVSQRIALKHSFAAAAKGMHSE